MCFLGTHHFVSVKVTTIFVSVKVYKPPCFLLRKGLASSKRKHHFQNAVLMQFLRGRIFAENWLMTLDLRPQDHHPSFDVELVTWPLRKQKKQKARNL